MPKGPGEGSAPNDSSSPPSGHMVGLHFLAPSDWVGSCDYSGQWSCEWKWHLPCHFGAGAIHYPWETLRAPSPSAGFKIVATLIVWVPERSGVGQALGQPAKDGLLA